MVVLRRCLLKLRNPVYYLLLVLFTPVVLSETATQTDWSGGDGVPGPVTDWGNFYDESTWIDSTGNTLQLLIGIIGDPFEHTVDEFFENVRSVHAEDIDGDGDIDVLGATFMDSEITWWENSDGTGTVWAERIIDGSYLGAMSVYATDMDDDGDTDVLGGAWHDDIIWWENTDGTGAEWAEHVVDSSLFSAFSVYATDVDGDGDKDVLAADMEDDEIAWWENSDGAGTAWTEHVVDVGFDGVNSVYAADIDGDGDMDVLGAAYFGDEIAWWENTDGTGTTWTEHVVDAGYDGAYSVYAANIDGDGDMDVLGAAFYGDEITWWENTNFTGTLWTRHTIDGSFNGASSVYATDVDGDGDVDVLGAADSGCTVVWWENTDGAGTTWIEHTIDDDFSGACSVVAADIDGDGYTDVLGAARHDNDIAWWNVIGYMDVGILESSILDVGPISEWEVFFSNSQEPVGTSVAFQFRSSADAGDMGAWSDTVFSSSFSLSGILADSTQYLQYRVILESFTGACSPTLEDLGFSFGLIVGIDETGSGENTWDLAPAVNPTSGHLSLLVGVMEPGSVDLQVYDIMGRVVTETVQELETGTHTVNFFGLTEGVYFCVMNAGEFRATERVVLLR